MLSRSIRVGSDLAQVPGLAAQMRSVWLAMGLPDREAIALEVCVIEAVNNAIQHAYGGEAGHWVDVTTTLSGLKLVIEVRDSGARLDAGRLARRPSSPLDMDVRTLPERGYGLFILKEALDEVVYETHAGDNVLTLTKTLSHLNAPAPGGAP